MEVLEIDASPPHKTSKDFFMTLSIQDSRFYKVAENVFSVSVCSGLSEDFFAQNMDNYEPFAVDEDDCLFSLTVVAGESVPAYTEETRQEEEGQRIVCGLTDAHESVFEYFNYDMYAGTMVCAKDYKSSTLFVPSGENSPLLKFAVNNALMVLYAIATSPCNTALFHAAVVKYQNRGYLFLGKSGTGKSTHARLWLKYNEGSELLNDDNPVVRFFENDGKGYAKVYGSPWSGKTPCYKNDSCDLGCFVLLSQAPFNKISRLLGVHAYVAILPCISGKRWERSIADCLHKTENLLASNVPVWHLDCLPDEAAAKLCLKTVTE